MKTVSWAPTISWALGTAPPGPSGDRAGDLKHALNLCLRKKQGRTYARLYPHRVLQKRHKRD